MGLIPEDAISMMREMGHGIKDLEGVEERIRGHLLNIEAEYIII